MSKLRTNLSRIASLLLLVSFAHAQPAPTSFPGEQARGAAAQQPEARAPLPASSDAREALSPSEMLTQGDAIVEQVNAAEAEIKKRFSDGRQAEDVVLILCLADKGNQVALARDTAHDRNESMKEAIESGDDQRARHEFRLLSVVSDSVQETRVGASECLGAEDVVDEWSLRVDIDPNVVDTDPSELPLADVVAISPVVGSPTD